MQHYEIVLIYPKAPKREVVSPETCEYEEAVRQVDELRPKVGKEEDLGLPWFAGSGAHVTSVSFRPVDEHRKRGESPTVAAMIEDYRKEHPELVVVDEAAPEAESAG